VSVSGYPTSDHFWEVAGQLQCLGARVGLDLRLPWAAHMTAARFTVAQVGEDVTRIRRLVAEGPELGESRPVGITIGWYECSGSGFTFHTHETIT
jgi:hypothetical protein